MAQSVMNRWLAQLPTLPRKRFNIFSGTLDRADLHVALRNLRSSSYESEALIEACERNMAETMGSTHAISFGAGRMALYAILEALDIGPGDEVVIPAYTCVVVPNAILYRGATPVYADIDDVTFNAAPAAVEAAITPRTKALYLQHTFGNMMDADAIRRIAEKHRLPVVEDCAHSLGGEFRGKKCGSLGTIAFCSTDRSKVVNTVLGGYVSTSDSRLAARVRSIQRNLPFLPSQAVRRMMLDTVSEFFLFSPNSLWIGSTVHTFLRKLGLFFYFDDEMRTEKPSRYPYPCRLSSAQAELGAVQLRDLPRNLAHRRRIARKLESRVGWYRGLDDAWFDGSAWLRYSFLVRDRDVFVRAFRHNFDLGIWFTSITHGRQNELEKVKYRAGSCPVAERAARHIVNFPTHLRIDPELLERCWQRHEREILDTIVEPISARPSRPTPGT